MNLEGRLLLIGCGKMGSALLRGWLERGLDPGQVAVVEPSAELRAALRSLGVVAEEGLEALAPDLEPAFVIFAVKPQQMEAVLPSCRRFAAPGTAFLSIAAGTTIATFEAALGTEAAVIRVMPNTPAAVGRGISVLCANGRTGDAQRQVAGELLAAVGEVAWIEDEGLMDAVTAVSGSGPAYVFLLIECLTEAGVEAGLAPGLAQQLARATVAGAGELARLSEETAGQLRRNVTSPGGTTQAALEVLMADDGLQGLLTRAVAAAKRRGRELGAGS